MFLLIPGIYVHNYISVIKTKSVLFFVLRLIVYTFKFWFLLCTAP